MFLAMYQADAIPAKPWTGGMHMALVQRAVRLRDHDNFYGSFKAGQDQVVYTLTGTEDDAPTRLSVELAAERVRTKAQEGVQVTVTQWE